MSQVVGGLEFALQLVVSEKDSQFGSIQIEGTNKKGSHFLQLMSNEESDLDLEISHTFKESIVSTGSSTQEHAFSDISNLGMLIS
ncbi:receptor-like kinase feronia-like protein [Trifolium medium]|uniref:Receptor-like kinase feronia-like protein n=1 Tax=Trifolium medium TaxID=97028 RepID=A0A392PRM4_9FABA|nr:receptor-like kinase feronia-like protein [Trifolium medium]